MKTLHLLTFTTLLTLLNTTAQAAATPAEICDQALESGEYRQAVEWAGKALLTENSRYRAYICLGRAQGGLGQHAPAVEAFRNADDLAVSPTDHIVALTLLGNEYQRSSDFASAASAYAQSLQYAKQENNIPFQRINLNQLGDAQRHAGLHAEALAHYEQGLAIAANDNERAESYANIAATHSLLGQHDKAIEFQIKAVLMEERAGDLDQYAHANIELGRICLVAQAYRDGEKWLNKFLEITIASGSPYWEAKTRYMLANLDAAQGRNQAAQAQLKQGIALAEKLGAKELLAELKKAASANSM